MSYTTAKAGVKNNNGGTIVHAGNVSDTTKNLELNTINASVNNGYGSKVYVNTATGNGTSDPWGIALAKSAGTGGIAYNPAKGTNYIMRYAGDNASKVNNDSSTVLTIPGGATNKTINKLVTTRQLGSYSDTSFNILAVPNGGKIVPGRTKGTGAGTVVNYVQADDGSSSATDAAATVSRSVPGNLTYFFGYLAGPTTVSYKAKNVRES
jgi:hypothetical protein